MLVVPLCFVINQPDLYSTNAEHFLQSTQHKVLAEFCEVLLQGKFLIITKKGKKKKQHTCIVNCHLPPAAVLMMLSKPSNFSPTHKKAIMCINHRAERSVPLRVMRRRIAARHGCPACLSLTGEDTARPLGGSVGCSCQALRRADSPGDKTTLKEKYLPPLPLQEEICLKCHGCFCVVAHAGL